MSAEQESKLGVFSTLSIGIGGMVGGGIFAVTGLTIEVTKGGAHIHFDVRTGCLGGPESQDAIR